MSGHPLNETPKERLERVGGKKQRRFPLTGSPLLMFIGLSIMVLLIVIVGVVIALAASGMLKPYTDAILHPLGG
jgi:hypothetical protein